MNETIIPKECEEDMLVAPPDQANELPASESDTPLDTPEKEDSTVALQEELTRLRAELSALREQHAKSAAEVAEFHELFPEMSLSTLPDSVWDAVKAGTSLSASVALYEKKRELAAKRAENVNRQNAARSPGLAGQDAPPEYFTPDDVRTMSPSDVRRHFDAIRRSMQSWNS